MNEPPCSLPAEVVKWIWERIETPPPAITVTVRDQGERQAQVDRLIAHAGAREFALALLVRFGGLKRSATLSERDIEAWFAGEPLDGLDEDRG